MIKVNNRPAMKQLLNGQKKQNRSRNRLILFALIVVTFLLTTISSLGINYYRSEQQRSLALQGADYSGQVNGPSSEQIETLQAHPKIAAAGIMSQANTIRSFQDRNVDISLLWGDDIYWQQIKQPAITEIEGRYPTKEQELMISKKALQKLGIENAKVGDEFTAQTVLNAEDFANETFVISGIYHDYSNKAQAYVSQKYFDKNGAVTDDLAFSRAFIKLNSIFFSDEDANQLEKKLNTRNYQWLAIDTEGMKLFLQFLFALGLLVLVIMLCAYLVIYNILYISIQRDIHYYGLLKTIGTTQKQIKQLIFRQVIQIALIGIPIGLISGGVIAQVIVPRILDQVSYNQMAATMSFGPLIFVLAALFAFTTLCISSYKPAKFAASITPIEAVNYTGAKVSTKKMIKAKNGSKITTMAFRNVFRNKKQALLVILSLFLGLSAFTVVESLVINNDGKYILNALGMDDMVIENTTAVEDKQEPILTTDMQNQFTDIAGVDQVHPITAEKMTIPLDKNPLLDKFLKVNFELAWAVTKEEGIKMIAEEPEEFYGVIGGIDESTFMEFNKSVDNKYSKQAFLNGELCLIPTISQLKESLLPLAGQDFTFQIGSDTHQMKVAAIESGRNLDGPQMNGFYPTIIVSNQLMEKLFGPSVFVDKLLIDYQEDYDRHTEQAVKQLMATAPLVNGESKIERYDNMHESEQQLRVVGTVLAIILGLLGLINYCNMLFSNIANRLREFALLEAIGMTRKQQQKVLVFEGLIYGGCSLLLTTTIGIALAWLVFKSMDGYGLPFVLPVKILLGIYGAATLLCMILPVLVFRIERKSSIIEQLQQEL